MKLIPQIFFACMVTNHVSAQCLTQPNANQVASNYALLFTNYSNATADRVLTSDFIDQSDSVESLVNNGTTCPFTLGSLFASNRAAFEAASSTQPNMPFEVVQTYYDCTHVFAKWVISFKPQQVQGIAIISA